MTVGTVAEKSAVWRSRGVRRRDPLDVGQEAHVEHAVGLVEDQVVDVVELERAAADVVDHAARGADDDLRASLEVVELAAVTRATIDGGHGDARDVLRDACAALRRSASPARASAPGRAPGIWQRFVDAFDERDAEGGRLARAGLGLADHVAAVEQQRDDPRLDFGRHHEAHLAEWRDDLVGTAASSANEFATADDVGASATGWWPRALAEPMRHGMGRARPTWPDSTDTGPWADLAPWSRQKFGDDERGRAVRAAGLSLVVTRFRSSLGRNKHVRVGYRAHTKMVRVVIPATARFR